MIALSSACSRGVLRRSAVLRASSSARVSATFRPPPLAATILSACSTLRASRPSRPRLALLALLARRRSPSQLPGLLNLLGFGQVSYRLTPSPRRLQRPSLLQALGLPPLSAPPQPRRSPQFGFPRPPRRSRPPLRLASSAVWRFRAFSSSFRLVLLHHGPAASPLQRDAGRSARGASLSKNHISGGHERARLSRAHSVGQECHLEIGQLQHRHFPGVAANGLTRRKLDGWRQAPDHDGVIGYYTARCHETNVNIDLSGGFDRQAPRDNDLCTWPSLVQRGRSDRRSLPRRSRKNARGCGGQLLSSLHIHAHPETLGGSLFGTGAFRSEISSPSCRSAVSPRSTSRRAGKRACKLLNLHCVPVELEHQLCTCPVDCPVELPAVPALLRTLE